MLYWEEAAIMIEMFNEVDVRGSGVIYASTFEQIKKMYAVDPEKAGELAISAIEMVLTGQISTDDYMIDMMLTTAKAVNENNVAKYESRVEGARQKKVRDLKLAEIADLLRAGWKQREIGEKLGMSQQNISYRIGVIRSSYPELLQPEVTETAQTTYKESGILQTDLQTIQTAQRDLQTRLYDKDTNGTNNFTNNTNNTKNEIGESGVFVEKFVKDGETKAEAPKKKEFYF